MKRQIQMSFKYRVLRRIVMLMNIKKASGKPADEIIAIKKKQNQKLVIPKLHDADIAFDRISVDGFTVLRMIHKGKAKRANMFVIGGGMVSPPRPGSIRTALKFAKETGLDLYIPYYPLCVDYPLTKAYGMIHDTYKKMLEEYSAENISLLGTSSGGNLALGLVAYINANHLDTPMPGYIMAISPGTCCADEEEWQRMLELDRKDVAISAQYMKTAEEIMRHGDDHVPDYMLFLQKGDFTGCPYVTFIYGSDETLYAVAPSFEKAMKKHDVAYEMIVGEGMFHCYPVFPIVKEAREGWKEMVRHMKKPWKQSKMRVDIAEKQEAHMKGAGSPELKKKTIKTLKSMQGFRRETEKRFSADVTDKIWLGAHKRLYRMYMEHTGLLKKEGMHTDSFIFPRAAIYLAIKDIDPDVAYEVMRIQMAEKSEKMGRTLAKLCRLPGFKRFFLIMWDSLSRKMFGEEAGFKNVFYPKEKDCFRMDITQCPYHKYLTELGCPEINGLFCENDVHMYGNLPGMRFTRTQTIGTGGDLCDFMMEIKEHEV